MMPCFLVYQSEDKVLVGIVLMYLVCSLPFIKDKSTNITVSLSVKDLSKIASKIWTLRKWRRLIKKIAIDCCSYVLNKLKSDHSEK